jgi:hypothetical protein
MLLHKLILKNITTEKITIIEMTVRTKVDSNLRRISKKLDRILVKRISKEIIAIQKRRDTVRIKQIIYFKIIK